MAIFWNHIKGTGNATDNNNGLWTWIEWSKETLTSELTDELSGKIWVRTGNGLPSSEDDSYKDLGNILTTKVNTNVYGSWNNYNTWNWYHKDGDKITNVLSITPQESDLQINTPKGTTWLLQYGTSLKFQVSLGMSPFFELNAAAGYPFLITSLNITNTGTLTNNGIIKATEKCEALYFNATSDKRAKENITPATFSGLDLINKLSLYTFNYKNTAGTVPGILAQDLLEVQPEDLDLVDNIAATGENGDYMSIKEGKLIFVLMQAIKEQQAQIDELKAELKKLTK